MENIMQPKCNAHQKPSPTKARIVPCITAASILAASLFVDMTLLPGAHAATGCCMIRTDKRSEWRQDDRSFKSCKKLNADKDGKSDKLLKKTGLVRWNIRC